MGKDPFVPMSLDESDKSNVTGSNSGNLLFAQSVHKTLSVPGVTIGRVGYLAKPSKAAAVNEKYDALVLPMANAFRNEWVGKLDAYTAMISQMDIPVTVIGIGVQTSLDYELENLRPVEDAAKRFMAAVLDRSASVGVRGECTAAFLAKLGFKDDVVKIIGCPSMYSYGDKFPMQHLRGPSLTSQSKVSINVTSSHKKQTFREGLDLMLDIADRHVAKYPNSIVVPQEARALKTMLWGRWLGEGTDYDGLSDASMAALDGGRGKFFVDCNRWFSTLSEYDFAFGSRLHGNIAALLGGTPAFMLATDSRTRELAELFSIPWKRIDQVDVSTDAAELAGEADYSEMLRKQPQLFANYISFVKSNGLPSIYDNPSDAQDYETRLATVPFAPAASGVPTDAGLKRKYKMELMGKKLVRAKSKIQNKIKQLAG